MLFLNEHVVELSAILEVLKCGAFKEDLALNLVKKKNASISSDPELKGMLHEIHHSAT